jgi:hypothetical protein
MDEYNSVDSVPQSKIDEEQRIHPMFAD